MSAKYYFRSLLKIVISMTMAVVMSLTVIIPGTAVSETVGRFGEVNGSDGKFRWTESGNEKVLNYFYVGEASLKNQAFCIDHTAGLNDGSVRTGTESDLNGGPDYWKSLSMTARKGVMYTLLYGYNGRDNKVPAQLKARNSKVNSMDYLAATQFIVWEYTQGYRTEYNKCSNAVFYNIVKDRPAGTAYEYILEQIACHEIKASFLSEANDSTTANTYTMKWNENTARYEAVLKDDTGNSFDWTILNGNGINVSRNGSEYTFYTDKVQKNSMLEVKKAAQSGIMASDNSFRLIVFDGQGQALASGKWDPLSYYIGFTTEPDGRIEITKTSEDDVIEGVNFTITGRNLAGPMTLSTDNTGTVLFNNLKPGTYVITESVDQKYASPDPAIVVLEGGEKETLSFHNRIAEYSFKIRKYVMNTEYSPGCASFNFIITGDTLTEPIYATTQWVESHYDTQIGEVSVTLPGPGIYTIEEEETGGKYTSVFMRNDYVEVKTDGFNGTVMVRNTPNKGTLKLIKTSEDGMIHGVTFDISGENLSESITVVTDENGEVNLELLAGTYTITEKSNERYQLQESRTVTITKDTVSEVKFNNLLKRADLKIIKTSDNGVVEGKNFRITSAAGRNILLSDGTKVEYIDLITDSSGVAVAENLPLDTYSIVETEISVAYKEFEPEEVTLNDKEAVTTVYMHNELKTGHVVIKKSAEDGVLQGHKFTIYGKVFDPEGGTEFAVTDFSAEAVTDSEGFVSFQVPVNLVTINGKAYKADESGFTIVETEQSRYEPTGPVTGIFVSDGQVAESGPIEVYNTLKRGDVEIVKTSENGTVEGFSFTLSGTSFLGDAVSITGRTDENGVLLFRDLLPSDDNGYTITENDIPVFYIPAETVNVKMDVDKTVSVKFENLLKKGKVKVMKTAEDGLIQDVSFCLKGISMAGEYVEMEAITDENGVAVFEGVPISSEEGYLLCEENIPVKYIKPDDINLSVIWNEVTKVSVSNILKKITSPIIKTDSDGNPLEGAGLAVYTQDSQLVFAGLTNKHGMLEGLELTVGNCYYVREFLAPEGYIIDETEKVINVLEDGTVEGDYSLVNLPEPTPEPETTPSPGPTEVPVGEPTPTPVLPTEQPDITPSPIPASPEPSDIPETGEESNTYLFFMLGSVAVMLGVIVVLVTKKMAKKE